MDQDDSGARFLAVAVYVALSLSGFCITDALHRWIRHRNNKGRVQKDTCWHSRENVRVETRDIHFE